MGGVTLRPLRERIQKSKSFAIAVRKLVTINSNERENLNKLLWRLAERRTSMQYNTSGSDMILGMLESYVSHSKSNFRSKIYHNHLLQSIDMLRVTLENHLLPSSTLLKVLIKHRLKQLDDELLSLESKLTSNPPSDNSNILGKYFCSQLVAELLVESSVLSGERRSHSFIPADFSSSSALETMAMGDHIYSPDLVLQPLSTNTKNPFRAETVPGCDGKVVISVAGEDGRTGKSIETKKEKKEKTFAYQFRSGDTLPPSVTKEILSACLNTSPTVSLRGHLDIFVPLGSGDSGAGMPCIYC